MIINPYTRGRGENETEPVKVPANLSTLPGTTFLPKRKKLADKSLGFAAKCSFIKPGSKWTTANGSRENTVVIDYITQPGEFAGKSRMVSVETVDPSEPCFISFTDTYGVPTGYTPLGAFLTRYPLLAEPVKVVEPATTEPDATSGERKRNAIDLGAIV